MERYIDAHRGKQMIFSTAGAPTQDNTSAGRQMFVEVSDIGPERRDDCLLLRRGHFEVAPSAPPMPRADLQLKRPRQGGPMVRFIGAQPVVPGIRRVRIFVRRQRLRSV